MGQATKETSGKLEKFEPQTEEKDQSLIKMSESNIIESD